MKKILPLVALILLLPWLVSGQIGMEKGYFITNEGLRTECLIKNNDWLYNPVHFQYQEAGGTLKSADIREIKEFGINGIYESVRFIRYTVRIDTAFERSNNITYERNPLYGEKTIFLKMEFEGVASLYSYTQANHKAFFYALKDSLPQLLVCKKYRTAQGTQSTNNGFRGQLLNSVKCPDVDFGTIERLAYTKEALVEYFRKYNRCQGGAAPVETKNNMSAKQKMKRKWFNLKITPGMDFVQLNTDNFDQLAYNRNAALRLGLEGEFVLPFNMNKWAIIIEPTYQSATVKSKSSDAAPGLKATYSYSGIELPVGFRYYVFLNKKTRLFVNAFGIFSADLQFSSDFKYTSGNSVFRPSVVPAVYESKVNFAVGAGVYLLNRISGEFRYYGNKSVIYKYSMLYYGDYSRMSLIMGIRLW